jgi:transcriptional regulator with XRE-family HTH domain
MVQTTVRVVLDMAFPDRLAKLRKDKGLTQQVLADLVGMHVIQIHRYESGSSQPTLEAIRKMALALSVSADELVFDRDERNPDEDLRLQFEAITRFDPEERKVAKALLESLILRHEARRWSSPA